ncbi:prenyltransferase/squalene oxidase repeat-containing protein [Kitasatospora sp. NPDC087861]|uniref:prenyltransferase/squalene oxidase repeat-containing protein n=1 Tax=Kitasatospora sp. NPDC087861 TaxID=3364070 RepID=UPI00381F0F68
MRPAPIPASLPRWPRAAFPTDLVGATTRLRSHLEGRIEADGAVRSPCHSRVLESALLMALLDRTGLEPDARARLADYLATHRDSPRRLDRLLARAALGGPTAASLVPLDVADFLAHAPDFTSARKHALLHAVLLLLGAAPTTGFPDPDAFSPHGLHAWARVQVTAVKAILAHAYGRSAAISEDDLALLRSTQHPGTLWEGNLLIHLSVLHALAPLPGQHRMVADGIRTALAHQRPDGGIPFISDEDTWVTATAAVALHTAGAPRAAMDTVAQRLLRLQHPGGWSYTERAQLADVDCTSAALEALHLADPDTHRTAIRRAIDHLTALQAPDGGFPTYLAGAPSEACMTAAAANALSTQGPIRRHALDAALDHLASQQRPDGSFAPDWSSSRHHTVFRATLAAAHHPGPPDSPARRIIRRATQLALNSQNSDGGWGQQDGDASDALSTAYALITLTGHPAPAPAARGTAYLLTQQRPDGSISSIPDSIGPRPFGFSVPALADVFTLLALGHLDHRLTPAPLTA